MIQASLICSLVLTLIQSLALLLLLKGQSKALCPGLVCALALACLAWKDSDFVLLTGELGLLLALTLLWKRSRTPK